MSAETTRRRATTLRHIVIALVMALALTGIVSTSSAAAADNPKAHLGPSPALSMKWQKKLFKIQDKFRNAEACYAATYWKLMRMRKPALKGPNYGYYGDKGHGPTKYDDDWLRGYSFMSYLAHAANGAYHFGFTKVKKKAKRKKLKRKMRKRAKYWVRRADKIGKEGDRTGWTYLPLDEDAAISLQRSRKLERPYSQPKKCRR